MSRHWKKWRSNRRIIRQNLDRLARDYFSTRLNRERTNTTCSAYDYFVNEALNAHQSFSHIRNVARRNDFGGSIGGPISIPKIYDGKDRTFFFFNMEVFKEDGAHLGPNPHSAYSTVSRRQLRAGFNGPRLHGRFATDGLGNQMLEGQIFDPTTERLAPNGTRARLQFPNNQIPLTSFDPSAVKYQKPDSRTDVGGLINNFNGTFNSIRTTPIPSIKIDHNFSSKFRIGFYYSNTKTETPYATGFGGSEGFPDELTATRGTFIYSRTWRGTFDYTLSPTMLLHFGAGYIVNDFSDKAPITNFDMEKTLGIKGGTLGPNNGCAHPILHQFDRPGRHGIGGARWNGDHRTFAQFGAFSNGPRPN